jgi:hypothetical protein
MLTRKVGESFGHLSVMSAMKLHGAIFLSNGGQVIGLYVRGVFLWSVWVLNILNINNILNLTADFKTMKMYLNVEYNLDSFRTCVWVLNF